jgi:hypothetical protein
MGKPTPGVKSGGLPQTLETSQIGQQSGQDDDKCNL